MRPQGPKLLDLYCGGGGAAMGYHRAGFTVVGVDHLPQPHYPFEFHRMDALQYLRDHGHEFDVVHASPPCQAYSRLRAITRKEYVDMIPATRSALLALGKPYVIENVPGAPLNMKVWQYIQTYLYELCGSMFSLATPDGYAELRRHRLFELNCWLGLQPECNHGGGGVVTVAGHDYADNAARSRVRRALSITGNTAQTNVVRNKVRVTFSAAEARHAMGIDWLPMSRLSQAIPPAYTEWIGRRLLEMK